MSAVYWISALFTGGARGTWVVASAELPTEFRTLCDTVSQLLFSKI